MSIKRESLNGDKIWYDEDWRYHREDGPAVEYRDGTKIWYWRGQYHREDGPAIERSDGRKEWYRHDNRHRIDGPAIEYPDGTKSSWWVNGKELPSYIQTVEQLKSYIRNKILW